jgi:phenylacetate-CoA ligase
MRSTSLTTHPLRRLLNTGKVAAQTRLERTIPFWPAERIEWLQRRRLRSIVRHAYRTVPFYRATMNTQGLLPRDFRDSGDIARLPLLDSAQVRRNLELFLSSRYDRASLYVMSSSGSTSKARTLAYWDEASILRRLAHTARDRYVLHRLLDGHRPRKELYILPANGASMAMRAAWDALTIGPRVRAERHFLEPAEPFERAVERIRALQPQVVYSFGSYAEGFFRWLTDRRLDVPAPRVWFYGGDGLTPGAQELMEGVYGCKAYSTYQSVETGRIGFQCERRQGIHLNVDLCAFRLIDRAGRPVSPGEEGEVVVSNLHNRAMVLLNYRLGDRAVLARGPCPCGRSLPLLEVLSGRTAQTIRLPGGREMSSLVFKNLFRRELDEVLQVQIVHSGPGRVLWRIVPFAGANRESLRRGLVEKGRSILGPEVDIAVEFVERIATTPDGKSLDVVSQPESLEVVGPGRPPG